MNFDNYQIDAARTINPDLTNQETRHHALFEIASEVGEIHAIFQKELQGHPVDLENLHEEIGDLLWGIAELCTAFGLSMSDIAYCNLEKLKKRYPNGFEAERSVHREV